MTNKYIYWFSADGGQHNECYWNISKLGNIICVPCPKMQDDIRPWNLSIGKRLENLIIKTEGDSWVTPENTKNRIFMGHSGGLRGCILAAAKKDGPWCGMVIGWCGWSNPSEIFTNKYNLKELLYNINCPDDGDGYFKGWRKTDKHQILLFVEPRNRKQVSGCRYSDANLLRESLGMKNVLIIENDNIYHDDGIDNYLEFINNYIY